MLEVNEIDAGYGRVPVLRNITFNVPDRGVIALLGANGAGKTTTLNTISGVIRPTRGTITFDGQRLDRLSPHLITRLGVSHVPQRREIFQAMTVSENLEMGGYIQKNRVHLKQDLEKVFGYFPILKERLKQRAGTLSGGEQQMLALGRGLLSRPKLLVMDEPSTGLAASLVTELFKVIKRISLEGMAILLVEQNVHKAIKVADYVHVLINGAIALSDAADSLLDNPELTQKYLGE